MQQLVLATLCALLLTPMGVSAQALPNINLARGGGNTPHAPGEPRGAAPNHL